MREVQARFEDEAVASIGIRVLVAVARADGRLTPGERACLEEALGGQSEATDALIQTLTEADLDLAALVAPLAPDARRSIYQAAFVLATADGEATPDELVLLELVRGEAEEVGLLRQVVAETRDTLLPSAVQAEADPELRATQVREDLLKYALLSAILGANPLAGAAVVTDLVVVAAQVKMVRDIGLYHGHQLDQAAGRSLLAAMLGSVGLRLAIGQLARLIPGFGSVYGAAAAFGSTWAVGRVAERYFAEGAQSDPSALRGRFLAARAEGERLYQERGEEHAASARERRERIAALSAAFEAGRLDAAAFRSAVESV